MRAVVVLLLALLAAPAIAQESQFQADVRREGEDLHKSCSGGFDVKQLVGCVVAVATDDPFHVAVGSLPPLNGMGAGLAFSEHYTPNEHWRISWDADGVAATSASWRAGVYMKLVHIPDGPGITVRFPGAASPGPLPSVAIVAYPVFNVYTQTISLNQLTVTAGQGAFSERQTIVGTNVIYPVLTRSAIRGLRPSLVGAVNGRFFDIQSATLALSEHPSFVQFEEGVRITPGVFDDRLRLSYLVDFQQFASSAASQASFHRWTLDLTHRVPLYQTVSSTGPNDANGPDDCSASVGASACPPVSYSRNLEGSISVRLLAIRTTSAGANQVPFFLQPTLGGSDINGQTLLNGYNDYQFRGPNLVALQESLEHSVWGPIGAYVLVEQGQITQASSGLGFGNLVHSVAVGLTLRAGGFPLVNLAFAWGGDGHRLIGTIDPTLLGGSSRPSLY